MPVRDRTGISGLKGIGVAALILGLAGCADREQRMFFDGNYYPASSSADQRDLRGFTASVTRASQGVAGAQAAALHEATRYCVNTYGTSRIDWANVTPGSDGPAYGQSGDRVSVAGRCVIW
ncbi:MAG: hypothetical protein ABR558_11835, partial [Thioalkalivibrio sp.]